MSDIDRNATGSAWAAVISAAIGGVIFGMITDLSEASPRVSKILNWYKPAGSLSGVAISATMLWLLVWAAIRYRGAERPPANKRLLAAASCILIVLAFVMTFPPFYGLL